MNLKLSKAHVGDKVLSFLGVLECAAWGSSWKYKQHLGFIGVVSYPENVVSNS